MTLNLLIIAGSAHVVSAFTTLVLPAYDESVGQIALILEMCELPIVVWFVVMIFRRPKAMVSD